MTDYISFLVIDSGLIVRARAHATETEAGKILTPEAEEGVAALIHFQGERVLAGKQKGW
jgi:hypothetical protein